MLDRTDDERIVAYRPLISPTILKEEIPVDEEASSTIKTARHEAEKIILGEDKRLLVVAGPCSIHDPEAALEYTERLLAKKKELSSHLMIIMRVYFEKPRTTIGWKGLINDPNLDNTFDINNGLKISRKLLLKLAKMGVPAGSEFLDVVTPQFVADLTSWGAIGARTTESQLHRELASGSSMPIGFKNGTAGSIQVAVDAILAAKHSHDFLGVTEQSLAAIIKTTGNPTCHLILRGSGSAPNYNKESVGKAAEMLNKAGISNGIMIDCSHGNSFKDHLRQPEVVDDICKQVSEGSEKICGVMLESFLKAGKQNLAPKAKMTYGQSVTDACMSWETTEKALDELYQASKKRVPLD